jgi:hypothetical protein
MTISVVVNVGWAIKNMKIPSVKTNELPLNFTSLIHRKLALPLPNERNLQSELIKERAG